MGLGGKKYFSSLFLVSTKTKLAFIKNRRWNGGKYCREWRRWSRVDSICQRRKIFEERKEKKRIYFSFSLARRVSVPRDIWIECGGDGSEQFHGERERKNDRIVSFPRIPRLGEEGRGEDRKAQFVAAISLRVSSGENGRKLGNNVVSPDSSSGLPSFI